MKPTPNSSRRLFLNNVSKAAVAYYILPRHILGGKGYRAPSDKLTLAIVGTGPQAEQHIRKFERTGQVNIGFLCDVNETAVKESGKLFPRAKQYTDYKKLLEEASRNIDGVVIANSAHMQAPIGLAAMQLDKHVYFQMPLVRSVRDTRMLIACASTRKIIIHVENEGVSAQVLETLPEVSHLDRLGQIQSIYCNTTGNARAIGVYLLGQVLSILSFRAPYKLAASANMPDLRHVMFHFKDTNEQDGIVAHWMSGVRPDGSRGTKNEIVIDGAISNLTVALDEKPAYLINPSHDAWIQACLKGYDSHQALQLHSNFQRWGTISEIAILGNLAVQSYGIAKLSGNKSKFIYPEHYIKLNWDSQNLRTDSPDADQFLL